MFFDALGTLALGQANFAASISNTIAVAAGQGAAAASTQSIIAITGVASATGVASGANGSFTTGASSGAAPGIGAASGISVTIIGEGLFWGFGAEAFGAEAFAGPMLADVVSNIVATTGNAAGVGAAAAVASLLINGPTVGAAFGVGQAAGISGTLQTISAIGRASGFGEAIGRQPTSIWPATLPQCPALNSWNETTQTNLIQFKPEVGPQKIRRKTVQKNWLGTAEFKLSNAQLATFKSFYETALQDGTLPFVWPHPVNKTSYTWTFVPSETPEITRMTPNTSKLQMRLIR